MDIGYARVSTKDQNLDRQLQELKAAGCKRVFSEKASGKKDAVRPEWDRCLESLRDGDRLVVVELSRLGRHVGQLNELCDDLNKRGVGTAVAAMERELLIERTHSGLAAARANGKVGGRRRSISDKQVKQAQELYDEQRFTMAQISALVGASPATLYRYLQVGGDQS